MTIPGFGNIVPIQGDLLMMIGWELTRAGAKLIAAEPQRIEQMRRGHAELVRTTGEDFGYDLTKWRDFLMRHDKAYGYRHPYAFKSVDRAVKAAIEHDTDYRRLAVQAADGDEAWRAKYAKRVRAAEREKRLVLDALKTALLASGVCPFCGALCPSYRFHCKVCDRRVRERIERT